jgi:7-cyano-7-deazaguanine synthase
MKSTIVLLSGGLDSSTLLAQCLLEERPTIALSIIYGQRHLAELDAAKAIAYYYKVPHFTVGLPNTPFQGSSQTTPSIEVPEGHYADDAMKVTVVPNRNMSLLAIAAAFAISRDYTTVAYAAHAGDHTIYPDCRPEFVDAMREALRLCHFYPVELYTPFVHISKTDIAKRAKSLRLPVHLTYSCYKGRPYHCGVCGTCVERKEALQEAFDGNDPTTYEQP